MKRNSSISLMLAAVATLLIGASLSAQAQFAVWTSNSSTDPTIAANWNGTLPTFGGTNAGILDEGTATISYTSAQGNTTFGTSSDGSFGGLSWFGFSTASSGISVSGGTVNFSGGFVNDTGTETLWIGNSDTGSVSLTGGSINVLNGTLLGRDGGAGSLSVTNGSFTTGVYSSAFGLYIGGSAAQGNVGTGLVTIGNGGLVDVSGAATDPISFAGLTAASTNTGTNYIDFTSGSTGVLELNLSGATLGTSYFTDLVEDGYVKVGASVDMNISDFAINNTNTSAATLSLESSVAVPEPSTWAMMLGGLLLFGFVARRRTARL